MSKTSSNGNTLHFTESDLFVAFRHPGSENFDVLVDNATANGQYEFFIRPFDRESNYPRVTLSSDTLFRNQEFHFRSNQVCQLQATNKEEYLNSAQNAIRQLQVGTLEKVVLSRIKLVDSNNADLFQVFQNLTQTYPNAFVYFFNIPGHGSWMGATPEILFEENKYKLTTVALAATQKVGDRKLSDVVWNQKEIEEQAIIQRYIEAHLDQLEIPYSKGPTHTVQAGNVFHLKTVFEMPKISSIVQLIGHLHPGPAICGMPKDKAMDMIKSIENHDRAYYCGYLGLRTENDTSLFINLRCMQIFKDQFALYVGGGLTAQSIRESEWEETSIKSKTLESVIKNSFVYAQDI